MNGPMNPAKQRLINLFKSKLASSSVPTDITASNLTDEQFVRTTFFSPSQFYRKTGFRLTYNGKELLFPHFENWRVQLSKDVTSTLLLIKLDRVLRFPWYLGGQTQINPHVVVQPFIIVFDADSALRLKLCGGDLDMFVKTAKKS